MSSTFYLPRRLTSNEKIYTEAALLAVSNYIVVLAEPGGGKTELLRSLAQQLGSAVVTANAFGQVGSNEEKCPLIIDAFDELAKVDQTGIHRLLAHAKNAKPTHVIISSRSSEWGSAATNAFKEFLGSSPLEVRLCEFDEGEQQAIFEHHVQENFFEFRAEVSRFDLEALLPNPQFLKLFADAYVESGKHFIDKRSIFSQAVERLAKEVNTSVARSSQALSINQKVELSSEVFAKLLLSGAEGVSTSEASEDRMYPFLASMFGTSEPAYSILATRLFRPNNNTDLHLPVHKIVAEYCAADYLTKRIAAPADPLTLAKCLPIIAPNSTVRDELRGLLGWMAALGNKPLEEKLIELDPYAVLANGDPSQLDYSSKRLLITRLKDIEIKDPYFRRGDFWRKFSAAGFFTPEVVEEVRLLLKSCSDGHLRDLILELLKGSPAISQLENELRQIVLEPNESEFTRSLAISCLLGTSIYDYQADFDCLISEASQPSLKVASKVISSVDPAILERSLLKGFFRACSNLYPNHKDRSGRTIGERYFVKRVISELDLMTIEWLLDELSSFLACVCGKKYYECDCRNGISKIIGAMLDRYFDLADPPFNPAQIWYWIGNLNFHERKSVDQSKSAEVLQNDDGLRQGIIAHVFGSLTDRDQIFDVKLEKFDWHSHAGLNFRSNDYKFVVDLAFENDNPELWTSFMAGHQYYRNKDEIGPNCLRRHMRKQASEKPLFMREWAKQNRAAAQQFKHEKKRWHFRHNRVMKRQSRKEDEIRTANIKYVQENRELVEGGRHWRCLVRFSELLLHFPDQIEQEFGDEMLVRNALRNCLGFIDKYIPGLQSLAELQCASKVLHVERVLYASCLEIMRAEGNLGRVQLGLLHALRSNIHTHYSAVSEEDRNALCVEVDSLIFSDAESSETFLRQYLEPQLANPACNHPDVWLLRGDEAFSHLRAKLSIEWLRRFPRLEFSALDSLFEIAAKYGNREYLTQLILERCTEFICYCPSSTGNEWIEQRRSFWFLRAWYFLHTPPTACWNWFKADKNNLLLLNGRSGRFYESENSHWPKLTSVKVEAILDAFIDQWPKVDLTSHWDTDSPKEEEAYRFLTDVIWPISSDDPKDALPVIERLLADYRYVDLHNDLKSMRAMHSRQKALIDFEPPTPPEIIDRLDRDKVVTVEGLRQLVIQELQEFQKAIDGGEFNSADRFYEKGERLDEVRSTEIIAERLSLRLEPQGITITPEHQLKNANRSDFTVTKMISGKRRLLVTEVKGQWHKDLYTAASAQLHERYSIHQDAEQQGIYLVIWFGEDEKVAGLKNRDIRSAWDLKKRIEETVPPELKGLIDVFVLDVSR